MKKQATQLDNIQIILCNTSHPGNIGSAARAMKTMGLYNLVLVAPLVMPDEHSLALSSNAKDVILNAKIVPSLEQAIADSHIVIAMTGRKREFNDRLLSPKQIIPEILAGSAAGQKISIVFGNEQNGLSIPQLEKCNRLVTIPGNPEYFSLNLAQAVQIMAYEIYSTFNPDLNHLISPIEKINQYDLQYLLNSLELTLDHARFFANKNKERTLRRLQRILHKADLEREEADLLHGAFKKIKLNIKNEPL